MNKFAKITFFILVCLTVLTPLWVFKDLLFPFVTSKAFYFRIVIELALPFYLYLILSERHYRPNIKSPLNIAVLAFLLVSIVSAIFGVNPLKSFFGNIERMGGVYYLAHLAALYFYILLLGQMGTRYLRWFLLANVGVGVFMALDALVLTVTRNHFLLTDPSYPRISATFGNPIFLASYLILIVFLTAYFLLQEEKLWKKIGFGVIIMLQLWSIVLSGTRGAIVGLIIGLFLAAVIYIIFAPQKKVRVYGGGAAAIFFVGALLLFAHPQVLPKGTELQRVFSLRDTNTQARLIQWKVALRGFPQRPILGTGSENYSIISNYYYDPAIYNYDKSWFDKPHNYLIEVLVTNGILGFLAYISIILFSFWGLYKAFRAGFLSLLEFCVLLAGLIAYQIQNLFVFDTVPASVAFFSYVAFMGFLWKEVQSLAEKRNKEQFKSSLPAAFPGAVLALSALTVAYVLYLTNIVGMALAKNINYGYAYAAVDPKIAFDYFEKAKQSAFVFDPVELGGKYTDFAISLSQNPKNTDPALVKQIMGNAVAAEEQAARVVPNDPVTWERLSNAYLSQAALDKSSDISKAQQAIDQALAFAPKRPEPQLVAVRLKLFQNDILGAENMLKNLLSEIPNDYDAKMQLSLLYSLTGRKAEGAALVEQALGGGYQLQRASEVMWVGEYYASLGKFADAVRVYELAAQVEPNNADLFWQLALVYPKVGQSARAVQIAQAIAQFDPARKKEMDAFIAANGGAVLASPTPTSTQAK